MHYNINIQTIKGDQLLDFLKLVFYKNSLAKSHSLWPITFKIVMNINKVLPL